MAEGADRIRVTLAYAPQARQVKECELELAPGTTAAEALEASGWLLRYPELDDPARVVVGIHGRKADRDAELRQDDRLEFCRPLRVDPKVARRERFGRQGARTSGLFSRRRPGGKAGY
jgi:uncharacterized protein